NGRPLSAVDELGTRIDYEYDEHGRCHSISHEWGVTHLKYRADGALDYEKFKLPCGKNLVTRYSYDKSGREILRQFEILPDIAEQNPKSSILELSSIFNPDGRLHTATLKNNEDLCRTETYTYTHTGQLQSYSCSGPNKPKDTSGKSLTKQHFTYNETGNINEVLNNFTDGKYSPAQTKSLALDINRYPGGEYKTLYLYDPEDTTKLYLITMNSEFYGWDFFLHIEPDFEDTYDDSGYGTDPRIRRFKDANGRFLYGQIPRYGSPFLRTKLTPVSSFDIFGRIIHNNYRYDAYDKLMGSGDSTKTKTEYFYNEYRLSGFTQALSESDSKPYVEGLQILDAKKVNRTVSLTDISRGCRLINQRIHRAPAVPSAATLIDDTQQYVLTNAQGTPLGYCDKDGVLTLAPTYTPFGYCPFDSGCLIEKFGSDNVPTAFPMIGMNGELRDPETGVYILGNGYRHYDPELCMFTTPDSLSPFGEGGVLPYAYCGNDPINHTDITGHTKSISQRFRQRGIDENSWQPMSLGKNGPLMNAIIWGGVAIISAPFTAGGSLALGASLTGLAIVSTAFSIASVSLEE
ncbi:MAG TPA: RHS repeat-associated core domain-containing protein, partial [Pseudomonas sp.]|uniref:RHS repeat-associated core domain-containing protein n=1 Tax=Pseudomonas sp. TaxID=306 RepID=UPI002EDB6222